MIIPATFNYFDHTRSLVISRFGLKRGINVKRSCGQFRSGGNQLNESSLINVIVNNLITDKNMSQY